MEMEEQEIQRGDPKDHASQRKQEIVQRREVAQSMPKRQPPAQQRIVPEEDLQASQHPSSSLHDIGGEVFCGQPDGQILIDKCGLPAPGMEMLAGVDVLGNAHEVEPVYLLNGRPAEHRAAADKKCAAPAVPSSLNGMVEQVLFIGDAETRAEGALEDILVIKMVRRLHESHPRIGKKRHRLFQEG